MSESSRSRMPRNCNCNCLMWAAWKPALPTPKGRAKLRQRELVKNALRMRPDRIIIGECRGEEAFDMLQAMNTGHEGSMTTVHANTPRDAVKRLEQMVGMAGMPMTIASVRSQIASAVRIIVQLQRLPDGRRRVTSVSEITGMEGDVIQMQEIYRFVKEHTDEKGKPRQIFGRPGMSPNFLTGLKAWALSYRRVISIHRGRYKGIAAWARNGLSMRSCSRQRCSAYKPFTGLFLASEGPNDSISRRLTLSSTAF